MVERHVHLKYLWTSNREIHGFEQIVFEQVIFRKKYSTNNNYNNNIKKVSIVTRYDVKVVLSPSKSNDFIRHFI